MAEDSRSEATRQCLLGNRFTSAGFTWLVVIMAEDTRVE